MDMLLIEGGAELSGDVVISGSKNASLPILAATILTNKKNELWNIPSLADTKFMIKLLEELGASCSFDAENEGYCVIDSSTLKHQQADYDIVRKMRASVLVLGPLIARFGHGRVSLPGGCAIGTRPIDLHLHALQALGAQITLHEGYVEGHCSKGLRGAEINFAFPSVGATEQALLAAVLASGCTTLRNAAKEPEVTELCQVLSSCGARIKGQGTATIEIEGVTSLGPIHHVMAPDRIEAGTFMAAAAANRGRVLLRGVRQAELYPIMERFRLAGCTFAITPHEKGDLENILVEAPTILQAVDMETAPYPGFPTDMQAQLMASMTVAKGVSHITERIFENRMMHVPELKRLGADISVSGNKALIRGVNKLSAAPVMATDLRASASLVIAAMRADGESHIRRIYHLDRGYVALDEKLKKLGARIKRIRQPLPERALKEE